MSTPPEAKTEYSRGNTPFLRPVAPWARGLSRPSRAVLSVALLGAVLLLAAEFAPLYSLHVITSNSVVATTRTGAHNSEALIPIAVLAGLLGMVAARQPPRGRAVVAAALTALGVLALLIALLGDLPDTHAHGLTNRYVLAATTPGAGLYLETAGALAVLFAGVYALVGTGVLRAAGRRPSAMRSGPLGGARSDL